MKFLGTTILASATLALAACGTPETAETDTSMEADAMANSTDATAAGDIVAVAQGNPEFSTLVSAVTAADLGATLQGDGPFTVFAPTNAAFEKIDAATLEGLMTPESKDALTGILTYHVVSGNMSAAAITEAITAGNGTAELTTVNGATLSAMMDGSNVVLTDAAGNTSTVTATDTQASNGVIHVIDTVLMPS